MARIIFLILSLMSCCLADAQVRRGEVRNLSSGEPLAGATVGNSDSLTVICDGRGRFSITTRDSIVVVSATGFESKTLNAAEPRFLIFLRPAEREIDAVVVTGTLRAVRKSDSPVAVEVYTPQFFKKNPAPSLFESLQNVNGVRPQLNCSICNTGDIHINGLEGPYTMVTIDGMPIVSSLASVYGLFGIPTQLIERVEIVKGPASGLYGSEAIGGLINIITKSPDRAPRFSLNSLSTSWNEHTVDLGAKFRISKRLVSLIGIDYHHYGEKIDRNHDQFTDVTLQHRISIFDKLSLTRRDDRVATLAGRFFYEDRWGGDLRWASQYRGSDSIYGESIYTRRWELIGNYQLPVHEKMFLSFSSTAHDQNSFYGRIPYRGVQRISFGQFTWNRLLGDRHQLLAGAALRYNYYDDNSVATLDTLSEANRPDRYFLPGIFVQDEWKIGRRQILLLGLRADHHPVHKGIYTPRIAWKWSVTDKQVVRVNAGTGFRVVSLFTEDHAALTGARVVEVREELKPERSVNVNLNYTLREQWGSTTASVDASAWYSHFSNQIIGDYDADPNKIIYQNLKGYAESRGITINVELAAAHRLKIIAGTTLQEVSKVDRDAQGATKRQLPVLTEKWSGTWTITWLFPTSRIAIDYTGNIYGPMRLPLLSPLDPRPGRSPVWSIQNIQVTKTLVPAIELFAGVKNLLNWTPARNTPFIIARSNDPFDKQVQYDADGKVRVIPENPYALTFDPGYVYAPNQGIRLFAGLRCTLK